MKLLQTKYSVLCLKSFLFSSSNSVTQTVQVYALDSRNTQICENEIFLHSFFNVIQFFLNKKHSLANQTGPCIDRFCIEMLSIAHGGSCEESI